MLTELENSNRKAALESFVKAVWDGREPENLLPLAGAAGLDGAQADVLAARIAQGREQLAQANQLPRLRKDAAAAQERLDKAQARLDAETAKLQTLVDEAFCIASHTRKAMCVAENCAQQLLLLHDEGLLLVDMPKEVARMIARRAGEEQSNVAHQAMIAATDDRNRRGAIVRNIEERLATMPIMPPLEQQHCENHLRDRLKAAKGELAKAESALKKAEAALESARKAVPTYP